MTVSTLFRSSSLLTLEFLYTFWNIKRLRCSISPLNSGLWQILSRPSLLFMTSITRELILPLWEAPKSLMEDSGISVNSITPDLKASSIS